MARLSQNSAGGGCGVNASPAEPDGVFDINPNGLRPGMTIEGCSDEVLYSRQVKPRPRTIACPVDCIHPKKDEAGFKKTKMLYIDPKECIACGACLPVCPVTAMSALK